MKIFMKWVGRTGLLLLAVVIAAVWSGCATSEKIAESLAGKNVAGSGFISIQKIGIDPESKIPTMDSTVISGDFQTIKAGTDYLNFREEETNAWYSSSIKTNRRSLTIATSGDVNLADVLRYTANVIDKLPDKADSSGEQQAEAASTNDIPTGSDVVDINGRKIIVTSDTVNMTVTTENGNVVVINPTRDVTRQTAIPTGSDTVYVNGQKFVVTPGTVHMTVTTTNGNVVVINPVSESIAAETIPTGSDGTVPKQVE